MTSTGIELQVIATSAPADGATFAPFVPVDGSPTTEDDGSAATVAPTRVRFQIVARLLVCSMYLAPN